MYARLPRTWYQVPAGRYHLLATTAELYYSSLVVVVLTYLFYYVKIYFEDKQRDFEDDSFKKVDEKVPYVATVNCHFEND
jgi:hypothetical protein